MIRKTVSMTSTERYLPVARAGLLHRGEPDDRSPQLLSQVIDQFDVEHNLRYLGASGSTYCNIFAWDVLEPGLASVFPHWVDGNGNPSAPFALGAREQDCNALAIWLPVHGRRYGWADVQPKTAQEQANLGYPAIGIWANPTGKPGHVVVVRPDAGNATDDPLCAQAGAVNANLIRASAAFGRGRRVAWWVAP